MSIDSTTDVSQAALVQWLSQPSAYPHHPAQVQLIETHISRVYIAGDQVYKLKKNVCFDFLDFSTPAAREHACREELRLNRRLAPDAYRDVLPITQDAAGRFAIGGQGTIVDWLVHMRRLPTELSLDTLFQQGQLTPAMIHELAEKLIRFYAGLVPIQLTPEDYREHCLKHVRGNESVLLPAEQFFPPADVRRVIAFQRQLLLLRPEIFDARVQQGRIVDGHGDLRPEHICLSDPPVIFDCIEFSPELRQVDVVDELSFLASECDVLGASWVGPYLFDTYERASGDHSPPVLKAFYRSYRACVRAKVAMLRADQLAAAAREKSLHEARTHLQVAHHHVTPFLQPLVLAVGGLPGTGKTTLSRGLAESLGAELLRTDVIRKQLFGNAEALGPDAGIYSPAGRKQVYEHFFHHGSERIAAKLPVIFDATFSTRAELQQAHRLATNHGAIFLAIECLCRPEIARERTARRQTAGVDASDAGPAVYDLQRSRWEQWPDTTPHTQIDTEQPLKNQQEQVLGSLRELAANNVEAPGTGSTKTPA